MQTRMEEGFSFLVFVAVMVSYKIPSPYRDVVNVQRFFFEQCGISQVSQGPETEIFICQC